MYLRQVGVAKILSCMENMLEVSVSAILCHGSL